MPTDTKNNDVSRKLEIFIEAARRANWDALHGPRHLRSGLFRPTADVNIGAPVGSSSTDTAAQQGAAGDGASTRR